MDPENDYSDEDGFAWGLAQETRRSKWREHVFTAALVTICLGLLGHLVFSNLRPWFVTQRDVSEVTLLMLAQAEFAGRQFEPQILGDAELVCLVIDAKQAYFTVPRRAKSNEDLHAELASFLVEPQQIELGTARSGKQTLGDYVLNESAENVVLFRTSAANFYVDAEKRLEFPYRLATYCPTLREITRLQRDITVYGGKYKAVVGSHGFTSQVFINHGRFVAKPGEPSLSRFVQALTEDISPQSGDYREQRVQRLLDFVSLEISYNYEEAAAGYETMRHPCGVLMTGHSDCSNKVILLASLLEQIGEDYLVLYTRDHVAVAVKQGGFSSDNGMTLLYSGESWAVAEATAQGFMIGVSVCNPSWDVESVRWIQRPKERNVIREAKTGRKLPMR